MIHHITWLRGAGFQRGCVGQRLRFAPDVAQAQVVLRRSETTVSSPHTKSGGLIRTHREHDRCRVLALLSLSPSSGCVWFSACPIRDELCLNSSMVAAGSNTNSGPAIGDEVQLRRGGEMVSGIVVEDYSDQLVSGPALGRDWAHPHRWAVALNSGELAFVDDGDLLTEIDGKKR